MMPEFQVKVSSWLQVKEAAAVSICVVLQSHHLEKYRQPLSDYDPLCQLCRNVLLYNVVSINSVVSSSDSKLAKTYGISRILITKCITHCGNDVPDRVTISHRTGIQIERVESLDFYNARLKEAPVDLGGYLNDMNQLSQMVKSNSLSLFKSSFQFLGVLLHGPPGCGKTTMVKHLAYTSGAALIQLAESDILNSQIGVGASNLQSTFKRAMALVREGPVIVFIDEIDTLCPHRERASLGSKLLTNALITEMDSLHDQNIPGLVVIGATNFLSSIDSALRRPGRFDKEVLLNVPTRAQRESILQVQTREMTLAEDVSLSDLATWTTGFVGADLQALCEEASSCSLADHMTGSVQRTVHVQHFERALHAIQPSLKKGLDCVIDLQPVTWEQIGGLEEVKAEIRQSLEWPLLFQNLLGQFDLPPTKGILLYGPPGCCKTTLVRAAATSCHVTFLTLNGAQVYSAYVGESERIISEAFQKARALSPSILFFDEMESLVGTRSSGSSQSKVQQRILSTMLNEMDGIGVRLDKKIHASVSCNDNQSTAKSDLSQAHVMVIGATNRPDMIDPAILRPGRLDKMIFVPPPDLQARQAILQLLMSKMPVKNENIAELSKKTQHFSGADLKNLCIEAGLVAVRESQGDCPELMLSHSHFLRALDSVKPSLALSQKHHHVSK